MIPKKIFTIWLSEDGKMPELIERCVKTHQLEGYEHRMIALENCFKGTKYIQECLESKQWAKAADYLRIHYLSNEGGIYLDADFEVLDEKNFDEFSKYKMFVGREKNNYVSNAIIGAEKGHPLLVDYLGKVERNFLGSGDLVFNAGMFLFCEIVSYWPTSDDITVFPPPVFLPYDWQTGVMEQDETTIGIHHFSKSWK